MTRQRETIAYREGLALAVDLHLNQFVIALDAQQVIGSINKGSLGTCGAIINEIRLQLDPSCCNFVFKGRATNLEAHSLAKHSLSLGLGHHVWFGQHDPNFIPHHIVFDE